MNISDNDDLYSKRDWKRLMRDLGFSPRQEQILACLVRGESDKQIAASIGIATPTVRTHMGRLFEKSGAQDRVELILYLMRKSKVTYRPAKH